MRGVFRITKAEFIKIFKKPTVYIMAFILMLACVLSLFLYSPTPRQDLSVKLSDENAITNYNIFMSDIGSDNKKTYDSTILDTDKKVDYVINIAERHSEYYNIINSLILELKDIEKTTSLKLVEAIDDAINCYSKTYNLDEINYFTYITTLTDSNSNIFYKKDVDKLTEIRNKIELLNSIENIKTYIESEDIINEIQSIYKNYANYVPVILNSLVDEIKTTHEVFITAVQQNSSQQSTQLTQLQITKLKDIYSLLKKYNQSLEYLFNTNYPIALISKENYENYSITFSKVEKIVKLTDADLNKFSVRLSCAEELSKYDYISNLKLTNNAIEYINITNKDFVKELTSIKKQANENSLKLYNNIVKLKSEDTSTTNICKEITNYKLLSLTYKQNIADKLTDITTSNLSISNIKNLYNYNFDDFSRYELNERISKNTYFLETNTYSNDYLNVFAFNVNSDVKTNMYDYMYFAIKICTLLIIIFTMFMIASIISSEQDNGTIKLLLVRPYSRGKILSAKLLATFFFSLCFMLFSVIITLVGGVLIYGLPTTSTILATFNATTTFTISPILLMLLFVLSCLFDIIFYLLISAMLSVVLKSYVSSITTSMLLIVIVVVLSALLPSSIIYTFIPFTSLSLFRFFGNSFLPTGSEIINMFFLTPISPSMTFWSSIIVSGVFSIVTYIITFFVFKKRDF